MASTPPGSRPAAVLKRKRKAWTIEQKLFVIELGEQKPRPTLDVISQGFESRFKARASKTTLSNWLQPSTIQKVRAQAGSEYGKSRRRVRSATCPKLEAAVFLWFKSEEAKGTPLAGEAIFRKAKQLAQQPEFGVPQGFRFSQGWLSRFKSRHGIRGTKAPLESRQVEVVMDPLPVGHLEQGRENFTQLLQDSPCPEEVVPQVCLPPPPAAMFELGETKIKCEPDC